MDADRASSSERLEKGSSRKSLEQLRHEKRSFSLDNPGGYLLRQASDLGRLTLEKAKKASKHPDTLELFKDRYENEIHEISHGYYKIKTKVKNSGNFQYENVIDVNNGVIVLHYNYKTHDISHGGDGGYSHSKRWTEVLLNL